MTDADKLKLIKEMIDDFWGFNEAEDMRNGAVTMVTAISTVIDFQEDSNG